MTRDELARKCRSLYSVGGLYEIIALHVWADNIENVEDRMTNDEIAEKVMAEHGMISLAEFGKRMTMGEMKRMLKHAAELAREDRFDDGSA